MSTYPKAPRSPHTSPTTGAIAEELGWTPQSSLGVAHPTRSIRTPTRCFHHLTPSCYYDPIASPCGVGADAEKGAMPALDLQSLAALRIGWFQTS